MSRPTRGAPTYRDVLEAPEHLVAADRRRALPIPLRPTPPPSVLGTDIGGPFHRGRGGPGGWTHGGDEVVGAEAFSAVDLELAALWAGNPESEGA
jgi:hypothetical protein